MKQESIIKLLIIIFKDGLRTALYFPLWWYGRGFIKLLKACANQIKDFNLSLGFSIWVKNLFVPMFGQHDFAGRLISFFLRLVNIIARGVVFIIFLLIVLLVIVVWLVLPLFVIYQIIIYIVPPLNGRY
jgi:hypothetical protein